MRHEFGEAWELLFKPAFAHRGLWSPDGAPENSLEAFQAACAGDFGIELDVQLSADGEAMVFHDTTLDRMTGAIGKLSDRRKDDLQALRLKDTDETIPTLSEALAVVGHQAMVLIELKTAYGDVGALEKRVTEILIDHNGPTAVIGFNPYSHAWFAQHHPQILRGLNSYSYRDDGAIAREQRKAYAALEHMGLAKPQFLALGLDILGTPAARKARKNGVPIVAWTARKPEDHVLAADHADNVIFEGAIPAS